MLWSHWKGPFWVPELDVPHSWHLQCLLERSQRLNREASLRLAFVRPVCDAQLRIPAHFFLLLVAPPRLSGVHVLPAHCCPAAAAGCSPGTGTCSQSDLICMSFPGRLHSYYRPLTSIPSTPSIHTPIHPVLPCAQIVVRSYTLCPLGTALLTSDQPLTLWDLWDQLLTSF